jgi:hypothetical protein
MNRRSFLRLGGTSITVIPLFSFPIVGCNPTEVTYPLLQRFIPRETIELIGKKYLQNNPFTDQEFYHKLSENEAADMVKKDFEEDRIVIVSGWVLSITEARLCAVLQVKKQ